MEKQYYLREEVRLSFESEAVKKFECTLSCSKCSPPPNPNDCRFHKFLKRRRAAKAKKNEKNKARKKNPEKVKNAPAKT